tara:strand:- start:261 stop:680 length:420 start_codon:yes stop_codon:yes gene_type:complete
MKPLFKLFLVILLGIGITSFDLIYHENVYKEQTTQWVKIGKRVVNMKADHDEIPVTANAGVFTKLKFKVNIAPILIKNIKIVFGNGETKNIVLNRKFAAGTESNVIDLPGNRRVINKIIMNYKSFPGYGKSVVVVWGKR